MPLTSGEVVAGYKIQRLLGSGGMGEVYLAQHPNLPKLVALKVLPREFSRDANYRARFDWEADSGATLSHPHIVGVHNRGEDNGRLWISMDYVDGIDARHLLRDHHAAGVPPEEVIRIVSAVAEALDYAHESNIFHRDVKPDNIFLTKPRSGLRRILLGDFGIARSHDGGGLTEPGDFLGTHYYAAPEQQMGESVDGRADQYALAVTAYELLTGSLPYDHPTIAGMINLHLNGAPPLLSRLRPDLAAYDAVLAIALSKAAGDRFPTCGDFARALTLAQSNPRAAKTVVASTLLAPAIPIQSAPSPATAKKPLTLPFTAAPELRPQRSIRTVGAVITILVLGATALFLRPWHGDVSGSGTTTTAPAASATLTFDTMRDFVTGYYSDLPAHPYAAWAKLDTHFQNETGQKDFDDFWAGIQAVTVISVSQRDSTGLTVRLNYVRSNGTSDTEDRRLRMAVVNGVIQLDGSERIAAVAKPQTTTTTTTDQPPSGGDLGLPTPMSYPSCNGQGIVILGSVTTPGLYAAGVQRLLDAHPGAFYLRTDQTCPSLRPATEGGNPIYAVFTLGGTSLGQVCSAVHDAGDNAYGKWLDTTTDPGYVIPC